MTENEFVLFDRIEAIRTTISKYGEDKFHIAFSGGKDSCVVHHLIDEAIPIDCIITRNNKVVKFHPLSKVSAEWEQWYINERKIELCKLYNTPFNFVRTGCKGCPYSLDLQKQLEVMEIYLPSERAQCEMIWKPVYDEYRRIGYRLKKKEQLKLL